MPINDFTAAALCPTLPPRIPAKGGRLHEKKEKANEGKYLHPVRFAQETAREHACMPSGDRT
ncbi:hypothetical protein PISMIDRAFT_675122 [Pisolithus microcarpus 441]|uniref:Uncharacterized protein n=1 Tax=Pisolithus microcarpus 441 TaxID=765257 RepID=A0A0C9ZYE9_9AGAM|nr:hypothetical protein PISMIDRAFT_675122 [Pisolithus microcarpus 441]